MCIGGPSVDDAFEIRNPHPAPGTLFSFSKPPPPSIELSDTLRHLVLLAAPPALLPTYHDHSASHHKASNLPDRSRIRRLIVRTRTQGFNATRSAPRRCSRPQTVASHRQQQQQKRMASNGGPDLKQHALIAGATAAAILTVFLLPTSRGWVSTTTTKLSKRRRPKVPLEHWVDQLRKGSFVRLLDAFGPDGSNAAGGAPGAMIASPSRPGGGNGPLENADYGYQWTSTSS